VGGKRVLGDARGQLVHFPLPRQHGFRCQWHIGLVADDGVLVLRGAGDRVLRLRVNFGRPDIPQVLPAWWRRPGAAFNALDLTTYQSVDITSCREVAKSHDRIDTVRPPDQRDSGPSGQPRIRRMITTDRAVQVTPFGWNRIPEFHVAVAGTGERIRRPGPAQDRTASADPRPHLLYRIDPRVRAQENPAA
jgi:hypothetical protein